MDIKDAIRITSECISKGQIITEATSFDYMYTVKDALDKQVPKKPSYIYNGFDKSSKRWRCPNCTALLYEIDVNNCGWGHQADYCEDCGQAIDWDESR